ncbi:unnamed protein product [Cyclocybe aegerita]|uniref:Nucleolar protein 16 n=1 Tax=Cyclocybe aegerita TaxID=1973307 RepID=A0A8S0WX30_CYCAE|nr:unnamed protein product [Cyclocybe aegerita]
MANPRQRRKARSSSHKPVSHSRHAKRNLKKTPPIRGPKVLQDAWDKKKTVRQNYAKLGLLVSSDPVSSGGVETPLGLRSQNNSGQQPAASTSTNSSPPNTSVPSGFGRIVRDEAGNVIGIEMNEEEDPQEEAMETDDFDLDGVDSHIDEDVRQRWAKGFPGNTSKNGQEGSIAEALESISATPTGSTTLSLPLSGVGSRHISSGEVKYLEPLVKKHGSNVEAMGRDVKLNPEQRTVGQLRRGLRKAGLPTQQ